MHPRIALTVVLLSLAGCYHYYQPVQVAPTTTPLHDATWRVLGGVTATRCDPNNSLKDTVADALAKAPGADALIDVVVDYRVEHHWFIFGWTNVCTIVSGTAIEVTRSHASRRSTPPEAPAEAAPAHEESAEQESPSQASKPAAGPCATEIAEICECRGPDPVAAKRACLDAKRAQRTYGSDCRSFVARLRQTLKCAKPAAP